MLESSAVDLVWTQSLCIHMSHSDVFVVTELHSLECFVLGGFCQLSNPADILAQKCNRQEHLMKVWYACLCRTMSVRWITVNRKRSRKKKKNRSLLWGAGVCVFPAFPVKIDPPSSFLLFFVSFFSLVRCYWAQTVSKVYLISAFHRQAVCAERVT